MHAWMYHACLSMCVCLFVLWGVGCMRASVRAYMCACMSLYISDILGTTRVRLLLPKVPIFLLLFLESVHFTFQFFKHPIYCIISEKKKQKKLLHKQDENKKIFCHIIEYFKDVCCKNFSSI